MKSTTLALGAALVLTLPVHAADKDKEAKADAPGFNELDKDDDGRVSKAEAARNPQLAAKFDESDTDKDGFLSRAEYLRTAVTEDWRSLRERASEAISPDDKGSSSAGAGSSGRK